MNLATVLILFGVAAFAYGVKPVSHPQLLAKFLDSLHHLEQEQKEVNDWNSEAKRNNGNSNPSWNPVYVPQTQKTPEKRHKAKPSGPHPSGHPVTIHPSLAPSQVNRDLDDDENVARLLHKLRQVVERLYEGSDTDSDNANTPKPTPNPKHTNPTPNPNHTSEGPESEDDDDEDEDDDDLNKRRYGNGIQNTGTPFTGRPFTGRPFTGRPFTGRPFTGRPFTGRPFTGRPFTGRPFTGRPFTGQPFTGRPFTGRPFTGRPHTGQPFTGRPYTGEPFTGRPYTNQPFTDEPTSESNVPEKKKMERRELVEILGSLRQILERFDRNENNTFTTDSSPIEGSSPTTKAPGFNDDNDSNDDQDDVRDLLECWMNDRLGDFFREFPYGSISNNLTIDGDKIQYILTRAVRQFQLSDGEMYEVLRTMFTGLFKAVIMPHNVCPSIKFHQVVIWAMRSQLKYHLSNDPGSFKEKVKAALANSTFDPSEVDDEARCMVKEAQLQLEKRVIQFMENELLNDFVKPFGFVIKRMIPMFGRPRNDTKIEMLLHVVEEKNPWLTTCITPYRLAEMHRDIINRLDKFVKHEEISDFLKRAEDVLNEELFISTGSEQKPVVKEIIVVLEAHIKTFVNTSKSFSEAFLNGNTDQLTRFLEPITKPSERTYIQRIMNRLGPVTTSSSTPAPVISVSAPKRHLQT